MAERKVIEYPAEAATLTNLVLAIRNRDPRRASQRAVALMDIEKGG